jgi:hypothetical protein
MRNINGNGGTTGLGDVSIGVPLGTAYPRACCVVRLRCAAKVKSLTELFNSVVESRSRSRIK